jgi:hypothetical protein
MFILRATSYGELGGEAPISSWPTSPWKEEDKQNP